jgi:DNA-binding IclR family transcriptional regulator
MPISADQFEEIDDESGPTQGTNADKILSYLAANPEKAFTQSEIVDATDVTAGSVGPTLVRLRERGRVDHRGTYWRVSDHAKSLDAARSHADASVADRENEAFDQAAWAAHASDPRTDRE